MSLDCRLRVCLVIDCCVVRIFLAREDWQIALCDIVGVDIDSGVLAGQDTVDGAVHDMAFEWRSLSRAMGAGAFVVPCNFASNDIWKGVLLFVAVSVWRGAGFVGRSEQEENQDRRKTVEMACLFAVGGIDWRFACDVVGACNRFCVVRAIYCVSSYDRADCGSDFGNCFACAVAFHIASMVSIYMSAGRIA